MSKVKEGDRSPEDQHHWSGWPGAFCLKCFCKDPIEQAFGDRNFIEVADDSEMGFHYEFPNVEVPACSVKGVLVWNHESKKWDLHKEKQDEQI